MKRALDRLPRALLTRWLRSIAVVMVLMTALAFVAALSSAHPSNPTAAGMTPALSLERSASGLLPTSLTHAGNNSCPTTGPLGSLNTVWTVVVLAATGLIGLGVGVGLGRWTAPRKPPEPYRPALNPQPLPPGLYAPGQGPGGEVGRGGQTENPTLNPQPLPPGIKQPPEMGSGGNQST